MAKGRGGGKLLNAWLAERKGRARKPEEEDPGPDFAPKVTSAVALPQPGLTSCFYHLPIMPSNYALIGASSTTEVRALGSSHLPEAYQNLQHNEIWGNILDPDHKTRHIRILYSVLILIILKVL